MRARHLLIPATCIAGACARPVPPPPVAAPVQVALAPAAPDTAVPDTPAPSPALPAAPPERLVAPVAVCAEPARLVLVGSLRGELSFVGDMLAAEDASYDPETLGKFAPVTRPDENVPRDPPHAEGRYCDTAAGLGIVNDEDGACMMRQGVVEEIATGKLVARFDAKTFGGTSPYITSRLSRTGRLVVFTTSRSGTVLFDLQHLGPGKQASVVPGPGFGLHLSPDDRYVVAVPSLGFVPEIVDGTVWAWIDLGRRPTAHVLHELARSEVVPGFDAAFCGRGNLFALSLPDRIDILRGKDARVLASRAAPGGGKLAFSVSGRYLAQGVGDPGDVRTLVYRLEA